MENTKNKMRKSTVVTTLITIYFIVLCAVYAPKMVAQGKTTQMIICVIVEVLLITATFLFLRRRERMSSSQKGVK